MEYFNVTCCISVVLCFVYLYIKWVFSYWRRKNITFHEPKFPFGNLKIIKREKHLALQFEDICRKHPNSPMVGVYFYLKPVLVVMDPNLLRHILIKDFQCFSFRGIYHSEKIDPLSANLFTLTYDRWKPLRTKLSSTFTSSKMKFMFSTMASTAKEFSKCVDSTIKTNSEIDLMEMSSRFTIDVIGNCAFGVECNSLWEPKTQIRKMALKPFIKSKLTTVERIIVGLNQNLAALLGIRYSHHDVSDFFTNLVKDTISYRETNDVQRNDFMSLLIDMKNSHDDMKRLNLTEIVAQTYAFFLAGYETSSTTIAFALHQLAIDKNIQNQARAEILSVLEKHNGEITYDSINEMTFVDMIIKETMRMHPPLAHTARVSTRNYTIPDSHLTIPKGMYVYIPIYAVHHDPRIYPNPYHFDPKRFEPEQVRTRPSCAYLPFGEGPRNCIGLRFGMLQVKIGFISLLEKFEFSLGSKTSLPLKYDERKLTLGPKRGVWLKVSKIH